MNLGKYFSLKDVLNDLFNEKPAGHMLSDAEIQEFQNCLLEIYNDLINVCDKYDIQPMLAGGTLLGKIRHNSFIPWDEDMDIAMSRGDYEKFKSIFREELSDKYFLMYPGSENGSAENFMKLYKKNSLYRRSLITRVEPEKIFIDIFPIDYTPDNLHLCKVKGWACNLLMGITSCVALKDSINETLIQYMQSSKRAKINLSLRIFGGKIFSFKTLQEWYVIIDRFAKSTKQSNYCTSSFGRKHYYGETMPADVYFPLQRSEFCGKKAWIMNNPGVYLSRLYGDYMSIPTVDKREHHFVKEVRFDNSEGTI